MSEPEQFRKQEKMGILHHAVLFGLFARNTSEMAGEPGLELITAAVHAYGLERGSRMAQRARADGIIPSITNYLQYGEWQDEEGEMVIEDDQMSPVYQTKVLRCAWNEAWKQYGLENFGRFYCEQVDDSLVEGYLGMNPLKVESFLSRGDACCFFVWTGLDRTTENENSYQEMKKRIGTRHIRDFNYHTAHLYFTFSSVLTAQLGISGEQIIQKTASDFRSLFSDELFNRIRSFEKVDFTHAER